MTSTPHIELDSQAPDTVDGRQIRAVAFQDVRAQYVTGTMKTAGLVAAGSRALVVGSGRGLLAGGLAQMGFDVVAVDPSATATAMAREAHERQGLPVVHQTAPAEDLGLPDDVFDISAPSTARQPTAADHGDELRPWPPAPWPPAPGRTPASASARPVSGVLAEVGPTPTL
ncbi:MAG TPA: class I SAM-dependent methyltransferase [Streptosporangiaceae bacterium]|jgi:SAM-dependent methyltransferase